LSLRSILLHRISTPAASVIAGLCGSVCLAIISGSYCVNRLLVDRDTPEVCEVYLEQNAFVLQHFGRLHRESFKANESCAFLDGKLGGCTVGVYTYAIAGSRAEGVVQLAWIREPGLQGSLLVPYLQIMEHRSTTGPRPVAASPRTLAPVTRRALLYSGPVRLRDAA
jgi:hypothetical protein